jgi:hypothetical protein
MSLLDTRFIQYVPSCLAVSAICLAMHVLGIPDSVGFSLYQVFSLPKEILSKALFLMYIVEHDRVSLCGV